MVGPVYYWMEWPRQQGQFSCTEDHVAMKIGFLNSKAVWPTQIDYFRSLPQRKRNANNDNDQLFGMQIGMY